ncbi:MAG TPA: preprotein translocase subunit YajC [Thermoanaerobacterales bacterium]|nr:preprotein translocase subunit YajC [Thermoanaerobacterales bacterium]
MNPAAFMNQFGPIIVIFAIFYFLIIRPQQKREKDRRNMLSSLKEGDDILTIGGIYGRILNLKEDLVTLDVGDKIKIKVTRSAIGSVLKTTQKTED